jgi:UDP-N-acetyl-D-mannosaminuronic acid dehydrogenase
MPLSTVCVLGLGYIGLPTALMLASRGVSVVGSDVDKELVKKLNRRETTFDENGLDALFDAALAGGVRFETGPVSTEIYIIAVPTPFDRLSKRVDARFVVGAVRDILRVCPKGAIIVIESTVSPGTIDRYVRPLIQESGLCDGADVHLAHAPERIIPGNMIHELEHNPRAIGADSLVVAEKIKRIYASFCKGEIVLTDIRSAEMAKVVENTFRDINIAFANELAKICRQGDMNVYEIIRIANMHPRVNILQPGPGVGGHCISVDPWFLVGDFPQLSLLIREARKINDSMPYHVLARIREIMSEKGLRDVSRVGFYGLTYKEDVDDVRESPTLQLFEIVEISLGSLPKVYDPMVKRHLFASQYDDFDAFLADVELVVIMTGHSHLRANEDKLAGKIVLDTRNVCVGREVYLL